ncbi:MAG: GNAT family N-acetyltransferase [Burkholderiales bacterium]|nr:GNAT family N-acetyltransferase [Burkholderiales bacterium]
MPDFILELARPADAQHLAEMSRDHIETGLGWHYRKEALRQLMADPDTNVVVARTAPNSPVIGFAVMSYQGFEAHLVLLAVAPAWRRRGVATALVQWHLKAARVAGAQSLAVELRADNAPARRFYAKLDFRIIQRIDKSYGGTVAALCMVKDLRVNPDAG